MVENTKPISLTNPTGWLRRMPRCGPLWCAPTFRSMEGCWRAMVLSKDFLRMRGVVATGGKGKGVGEAIPSISAAAVPRHRPNRTARFIRLLTAMSIVKFDTNTPILHQQPRREAWILLNHKAAIKRKYTPKENDRQGGNLKLNTQRLNDVNDHHLNDQSTSTNLLVQFQLFSLLTSTRKT